VRSGQPFPTALLIAAALLASACGGSTAVTSVVGPDLARCQTSAAAQPATVPADGGSVALTITAARDCTWTASSDAAWMALSATSGQGNGSLTVRVSRNEQPAVRTGAVLVNEQRVTITQEARPCTFELSGSGGMGASGGRGSIQVATLSGCAWTAGVSVPWIRLLTSSGTGSGTVEYEVAPNEGDPREAPVTVGDRQFTIRQAGAGGDTPPSPACTPTIAPRTIELPAAGGAATIDLTLPPPCEWTARSSASWLTITSQAAGRGSAAIGVAAPRNTGAARSAVVTVAQQTVTVSQPGAPACTVAIEPVALGYPAAGGDGRVSVTTPEGCEWTASSGAGWVVVTNGRGTGNGEARYTVRPNTTSAGRSTAVTIGGRSHTVTQQGAPCTYTLDPASRSFGPAGGGGSVKVTTQAGCAWSVSGGAAWVSVSNGQGSGGGEFSYVVQENASTSSRSATLSVAGQSHTIAQDAAAPACTFSLTPPSRQFSAAGGTGTVSIATQPGCQWTASSGAAWTSLGAASGTGPGDLAYTVQVNSAAIPRSTTVTINGQTHTVNQDPAPQQTCTYALDPASRTFNASGGDGRITVTTQAGCSWTASSGAAWAVIAAGSGAGPGEVAYSVQPNTATASRFTTISVGGQSHSVQQEAAAPPPPPPCSYSVEPAERQFEAIGGEGSVRVTTGSTCSWTASTSTSWISVATSGGTGSADVRYQVAPNTTGAPREGTVTIGGQGHRVRQGA